jgi:hypothetical protein
MALEAVATPKMSSIAEHTGLWAGTGVIGDRVLRGDEVRGGRSQLGGARCVGESRVFPFGGSVRWLGAAAIDAAKPVTVSSAPPTGWKRSPASARRENDAAI